MPTRRRRWLNAQRDARPGALGEAQAGIGRNRHSCYFRSGLAAAYLGNGYGEEHNMPQANSKGVTYTLADEEPAVLTTNLPSAPRIRIFTCLPLNSSSRSRFRNVGSAR